RSAPASSPFRADRIRNRPGCWCRRSRSSTRFRRCPIRAERRSFVHGSKIRGHVERIATTKYNPRAMPMERLVVEGGRRLEGPIRRGGNKKAGVPILAACLLTDEPVTLYNLPDIQDVRVMLQIIEKLGVCVERREKNVVTVHAKGDVSAMPDAQLSKRIRA